MNQKKIYSWALYDWANSAFATTVMAGFFPIFFKSFWAGDLSGPESSAWLGTANSISGLIIVCIAPFLGALADIANKKKLFLGLFAFLGIIATGSLFFIAQGMWITAMSVYIFACIGFSGGNVFYDSLIINVSSDENRNRVSALGYSLGYLGGGFLFVLNVAMYQNPEFFGLKSITDAVLFSFLSVSIWWTLFLIPILLKIQDRGVNLPGSHLKLAYTKVFNTLRTVSAKKNVFIFLLAFFLYIDGVHTIMAMAADFALNLGLPSSDVIVALILVQFVAFPTTLLWSKFAYKFGDKNTLLFTISLYLVVIAYSAFLSNAIEFYILASMVGAIQGGIQSISRSYYATLIPPDESGEYFGFYNMFGRAGAFMGPALVAIFVTFFQDTRYGLIPIAALFIMGAIILLKVKSTHESLQS